MAYLELFGSSIQQIHSMIAGNSAAIYRTSNMLQKTCQPASRICCAHIIESDPLDTLAGPLEAMAEESLAPP